MNYFIRIEAKHNMTGDACKNYFKGDTLKKLRERAAEIEKHKGEKCAKCGGTTKPMFLTPKFGLLCRDCWCKEMGDFIEKHPIGGFYDENW